MTTDSSRSRRILELQDQALAIFDRVVVDLVTDDRKRAIDIDDRWRLRFAAARWDGKNTWQEFAKEAFLASTTLVNTTWEALLAKLYLLDETVAALREVTDRRQQELLPVWSGIIDLRDRAKWIGVMWDVIEHLLHDDHDEKVTLTDAWRHRLWSTACELGAIASAIAAALEPTSPPPTAPVDDKRCELERPAHDGDRAVSGDQPNDERSDEPNNRDSDGNLEHDADGTIDE